MNLYGFVGNDGVLTWDRLGTTFYGGTVFQRKLDTEWKPTGAPVADNWGFNLEIQNNEAKVTVPVDVIQESRLEKAGVGLRLKKGVTDVWDDKFKLHCKCGDYVIRVNLDLNPASDNSHTVHLHDAAWVLQPNACNTNHWVYEDVLEKIDPPITVEGTAAHETGHLLGNPENYNKFGTGIIFKLTNILNDVSRPSLKEYDYGFKANKPFTEKNIMNDGNTKHPAFARHYEQIRIAAEKELKQEGGSCSILPK